MPITQRSYYDAAEKGRQDRQQYAHNALAQQVQQQQVQQGERVNALMQDPAATPEQYARVGRSDVANAITNIGSNQRGVQQDEHKRLALAAQYALASPDPKAFIAQNFPELAKANPTFDTDTPEQIGASLQQLLGMHAANAGIAPAAPAPVGPLEKIIGPDGKPVYAERKDAVGKPAFYQEPSQAGTKAPNGYRFTAAGALEPIPGGPADPNTPSTRDDQRRFAKADKFRDEFNAASKDFIAVGDSFSTVRAAAKDPTAAGDLSMIFAYMKMLDPNSVVREQEFANAQNATGVPARIRNQWNKVLEGERLNPDQRADFINQAEKVYKVRKARNDTVVTRYTEMAKRNNVNPQDVVGDLGVYEDKAPSNESPASAPVQVKSDAEYKSLKPGTQYIAPDGSTRTKR